MRISLKVLYALILVTILLVGGAFYYHKAENWSYVDSFYFSVASLTTVGYGDLVPTTNASKIFTIIYIFFGLGIMLYLLGTVVGGYMFKQEKKFEGIVHRFNHKKENKVKKTKSK